MGSPRTSPAGISEGSRALLCTVLQRSVWAEVTESGAAKTWHLGALPGETRCGRSTRLMKDLPRADWDLVYRPCANCAGNADHPVATFHSIGIEATDSEIGQQLRARHARRE